LFRSPCLIALGINADDAIRHVDRCSAGLSCSGLPWEMGAWSRKACGGVIEPIAIEQPRSRTRARMDLARGRHETASRRSESRGQDGLVIVANRLPVSFEANNGATGWLPSPGGLVSALRPVLQARSAVWVGWPGDAAGVRVPADYEGIALE